ncbi:hypothetical protein GCM10010424_72770 [Streptomyces lienomycini]
MSRAQERPGEGAAHQSEAENRDRWGGVHHVLLPWSVAQGGTIVNVHTGMKVKGDSAC